MNRARIEKTLRPLALVCLCYAVYFLLMMGGRFVGYAANLFNRAQEKLITREMKLEEFILSDLAWDGDALVATGGDPKLILADDKLTADGLYIQMYFERPPRAVQMFYGPPGSPYSPMRMAYAQPAVEGYLFTLPAGGVQSLRIDPGTVAGNRIDIQRIVVPS